MRSERMIEWCVRVASAAFEWRAPASVLLLLLLIVILALSRS